MVPQRTQNLPAPRMTLIKHLSEVEMQEHWEKGLCYNCDEKFTQEHRCVEKKLYLLDVDSPPTLEICGTTQDLVDNQVNFQ